MSPTLLILAAGMGSRYGGLKQLDAVGPGGETLLDYAVYDAIAGGFGRLVFVIRREFEAAFRAEIVDRYDGRLPTDLVYQEIGDVPPGYRAPATRTKPWGTGQAVWAARSVLATPFAVINADDFYGRSAFRRLANFLNDAAAPGAACLVGYRLDRTLSQYGPVSRGICAVDGQRRLEGVVEHTEIVRGTDGIIRGQVGDTAHVLSDDAVASMNCWGFHPGILAGLEREFAGFLERHGEDARAEFYLPAAVSALLAREELTVNVLPSEDAWFGVTYRSDRDWVAAELRRLIGAGVYPERLGTAKNAFRK